MLAMEASRATLPKRAHNPLLIAAGFGEKATSIPWWDGRPLQIRFRQPALAGTLTWIVS